jgi:hypothetical protein
VLLAAALLAVAQVNIQTASAQVAAIVRRRILLSL